MKKDRVKITLLPGERVYDLVEGQRAKIISINEGNEAKFVRLETENTHRLYAERYVPADLKKSLDTGETVTQYILNKVDEIFRLSRLRALSYGEAR